MSSKRPSRKKRSSNEAKQRGDAARGKASKLDELIAQLERLASEAPGGSPARPIEVTSAAVIEPRAHATACPRCSDGVLKVLDHSAEAGLRAVQVRCVRCASARTLWFRLISEQLN
jgi:hypothetical protein